MAPTLSAPLLPFTATDRCDRCGAQAHVRAILKAGDLLLCGHHGREHQAQLDVQALQVFVEPVTA